MKANYHTHTWRCNHAKGSEREYVEAAIERGIEILGFSDHTPYPFPWYHLSWFRMRNDQLPGYVETVQLLRNEYLDKIRIHVGLEAEYYPAYFPELRAMLRDSGVEYLLLGQHYLDNEIGAHYSGSATGDPELLKRYCSQTMEAMQTGLFSYFAHPDLICFTGDDRIYDEQVRQLCREAKSCDIPLEMNLLGAERGKHYPNRKFWEIAAEEGCSVILGCDTHDPEALRYRVSEQKALELIDELGMRQIRELQLRSVF